MKFYFQKHKPHKVSSSYGCTHHTSASILTGVRLTLVSHHQLTVHSLIPLHTLALKLARSSGGACPTILAGLDTGVQVCGANTACKINLTQVAMSVILTNAAAVSRVVISADACTTHIAVATDGSCESKSGSEAYKKKTAVNALTAAFSQGAGLGAVGGRILKAIETDSVSLAVTGVVALCIIPGQTEDTAVWAVEVLGTAHSVASPKKTNRILSIFLSPCKF